MMHNKCLILYNLIKYELKKKQPKDNQMNLINSIYFKTDIDLNPKQASLNKNAK